MNDSSIGFIGLGNVGSKVANNIISNGYKLYAHDLDEKKSKNLVSKGGIFCNSIEGLGNRAFSKSIVKLLEDRCSENLCARGFPAYLVDCENKKNGMEVVAND